MTKCSRCKQDTVGGYKWCKRCRDTGKKFKRKRKRTVRVAKEGHKFCNCCFREFPIDPHFKSTVARRTKPTTTCAFCRASQIKSYKGDTKRGLCRTVWLEWKSSHVCEHCGTGECIEADHTGAKKHNCSHYAWWAWNGGVEALKAELDRCRPLCRFCHALHSQNQRGVGKNPTRTKKLAYVNAIKVKIGECQLCRRKVKGGELCAYDFDHVDETTKIDGICRMVNKYPLKKFKSLIDDEVKKCRLLCCNCHMKHTNEQRRKASVENVIKKCNYVHH